MGLNGLGHFPCELDPSLVDLQTDYTVLERDKVAPIARQVAHSLALLGLLQLRHLRFQVSLRLGPREMRQCDRMRPNLLCNILHFITFAIQVILLNQSHQNRLADIVCNLLDPQILLIIVRVDVGSHVGRDLNQIELDSSPFDLEAGDKGQCEF